MASKLDASIRAYREWRTKGHEIWEIYDGEPNATGADAKSLAKLKEKLGRALPKDFEEFLRRHDGWEGYEYDRQLLSAQEILDDVGAESVEVNTDNMDEDEADKLADVFVVGLDNGTATILYYDTSARGEPELVEHYVSEQGRWPSLTAYFESLREHLEIAIAAERGTQASAVADWDAETRQKKDAAYHAELAARWQARPKTESPKPDVAAIADLEAVPAEAVDLTKNELRTYLGFCGYMLYVPTAAEVTAAALAFRRHFPWRQQVKACAPSDEYGAVEIAPDTTDYSAFLKVQSGGHFGLRMVDEAKKASQRIFNVRGMPPTRGAEAVASFLEVLVPADADPAALRSFVLDLADALPIAHGLAGYFALPSNAKWRDHMRVLYGWCRAHWALEIAHADEMIPLARSGLTGVSWLTLLDNKTAALVKKEWPPHVAIHEKRYGTVIEAGDAPTLGDVRVAYPKAIAAVHNMLAPLLAPGIDEVAYFNEQGGSGAWWRRFEDPAGFALGPQSLLEAIKTAVAAKDGESLRAALARLTSEAAASLHQDLSDIARLAIKTNKPMAVILYEHLTAGKDPHSANLSNALLTVLEKTSDPKIADLFVARALPSAKENPNIFYNVMCVYAQRGDAGAAIDALKKGVPHFTVELSKLLEKDAELGWLRAKPKFAAVQRQIQKRLGIAVEWPPLARDSELERAVGEHPNSAAELRRYATWLKSVDDPRGALIEAHMEAEAQPRSKPARDALKRVMTPYLRNRLEARYPKLASYFKVEDFRRGVLDRMYLSTWKTRHHAEGLAFLGDPECHLLRTLYLKDMEIDLAAVAKKVPYLQDLNLQGAKFSSLEPIREFGQLDELRLEKTAITDLAPLGGMKTLRKLYIGATTITDLRPIADLPALEFLSLAGGSVTNIEPLLALPRLCELWLSGTAVPKEQAARVEALITSRNVKPGPGVTCMVYGP